MGDTIDQIGTQKRVPEPDGLGVLTSGDRSDLLDAARNVIRNAYAPYSGYCVGAAIMTAAGGIFAAANVENASYGLTVCAERAATFMAVASEGADTKIRAIAVLCADGGSGPPCGACRQVLYEFGPNCRVIFRQDGKEVDLSLSELLPHAFSL